MKPVVVNASAVIKKGILAETTGKVVGFDSEADEVMIQIDSITTVCISSECISQNGEEVYEQCELFPEKKN